MDKLEEYIRSQREEFDSAEPASGHEARFLERLEGLEAEKKRNSGILFWRIAAAIILLLVLAVSSLIPHFNSPDDVHYRATTLGDVSDEMADVELYYQSRLAEEYNKIDQLSVTDPLVKSYLDELDTLNEDYKKLESTLYENGSHKKVVLAMIENFRLRLNLMEKLEKQKNLNSKNDSL